MNRTEFMRQLESLLQNISPMEREEALQYYNDYFDDAGVENEQSVIEALGTPAKVAENIKRDLYGSGYGDAAYQRPPVQDKAIVEYRQTPVEQPAQEKKLSTGIIVLIVVLCILASPFILGIGSGLLGTLVGILAAWFALILGFGAAAVVLLMTLVALVIVGIICMTISPLAGVAVLGAGFLCGGVGILFMMLTIAMAGIVTPAVCRGIAKLCRKLFGKKKNG